MPFRVRVDGIEIECDSVDDVVALKEKLLATAKAANGPPARPAVKSPAKPAAQGTLSTAHSRDFDGFFGALTSIGRNVLAVLAEHPDGVGSGSLASAIGEDTTMLPRAMRSLRRLSDQFGFGKNGILEPSQMSGDRAERSLYKLNSRILQEVRERLKKT